MTRRFLTIAALLTTAVLLVVLPLQTAEAKQPLANPALNGASLASCAWNLVPSPNEGTSSGLAAVTTAGLGDAWAVGGSSDQFGVSSTLVAHWAAGQWQIVTSPNPGSMYNTLSGVSATSPDDIWAVGYQVSTPSLTQTLIEHWNGSNWSVVPSPNPGSINNELLGVTALSAGDAWAVGFLSNSTGDKTLVEHWDGSSWKVVKSPNPGTVSNHLEGVTAVSPNDIWAVGNGSSASGHTLIEHWNGLGWSAVKSPNPGSGGDLRAVAAVDSSNVWAAGYFVGANTILPLIERWNGTEWQAVRPAYILNRPSFAGIAAISVRNVWAVGSYHNPNDGKFFDTLTEHWNGENWNIVKSPSPGAFSTQLSGIAAVSALDAWAVGYSDNSTLIERFTCQ